MKENAKFFELGYILMHKHVNNKIFCFKSKIQCFFFKLSTVKFDTDNCFHQIYHFQMKKTQTGKQQNPEIETHNTYISIFIERLGCLWL